MQARQSRRLLVIEAHKRELGDLQMTIDGNLYRGSDTLLEPDGNVNEQVPLGYTVRRLLEASSAPTPSPTMDAARTSTTTANDTYQWTLSYSYEETIESDINATSSNLLSKVSMSPPL